jgi:hypothetical protein
MKKKLFALIFAVVCSVSPIAAQSIIGSPTVTMNPTQWLLNQNYYSMNYFNGIMSNSRRTKTNNRGRSSKGAKNAAPKVEIDYTAFKENSNNSLAKIIAPKLTNERERTETRQMFDNAINMYKETAKKDGFPANDLAYAFEYFIVNNYNIYHDLVEVPYEKDPRAKRGVDSFERITIMSEKKLLMIKPYQEAAVYQQFKVVLAENPNVQKMTDAQKQQATEMFAVILGVNFAAYMQGINDEDEKMIETAHKTAKQGLEKLFGVSIEKIKIGSEGVEF